MDIARPSNVRARRIRQAIYVVGSLAVIALATVGIGSLKPAAPVVEAATLWPDTVKRGPMVRQVRGLGTLVPEDIRWIPATTQGRVERIVLRPGTSVTADSVILRLTNPELDQEVQDAQLKLDDEHASRGLMSAGWSGRDLQRTFAAEWRFTAEHALRLRQGLTRRAGIDAAASSAN